MGNLAPGNLITLAIIVPILSLVHRTAATNTNFTYGSFGQDELKFFQFAGDYASIDNGALQLTPETANQAFDAIYLNKSGRIFYPDPVRVWLANGTVASFHTTFVINIYRAETWKAGHGLAFLIAPNVTVPDASYGQWLGLTNNSTDGDPSNQIVAVEFDTLKQEDIGDPDSNHIGLNINSVRSKTSVSLDEYNITLSPPPPGTNYSVWVDYDGASKLFAVYMAVDGEAKPSQPLINETVDLKQYVKQESYFGFAASTGDPNIELNCVLNWKFQIDRLPRKKDLKWVWIGVGIGVLVVAGLVLLLGYGTFVCMKKRRSKAAKIGQLSSDFGKLKWLPGMPREFKYKELKKATNNFHESMKLGEGGFGIVYKGVLHETAGNHDHGQGNSSSSNNRTTRTEIAVKKFSRDSMKSMDDFLAELTIIHRLRHKNLVRLVGWCYEKGKLLLVYDFMPNGSLEKHLYEASDGKDALNWSRRYNILAGVASALHYLHNEYDQKVLHRDLKASNIMLDADFNARLGDFGLARALENERNSYAELGLGGVPGTMGYVAPECFHTGRATPESDVFGFGAVVLEVVCGKGPGSKIHHNQHLYSLVDWVWMLHREGRIQEAVDERLNNDFVEEEAKRLLLLGLACSHPIETERPKAQTIVQILSGTIPAPRVSPFKPAFTWPSMNTADITDSSLSTITLSSSGRSHSGLKFQRSSSNLPV